MKTDMNQIILEELDQLLLAAGFRRSTNPDFPDSFFLPEHWPKGALMPGHTWDRADCWKLYIRWLTIQPEEDV